MNWLDMIIPELLAGRESIGVKPLLRTEPSENDGVGVSTIWTPDEQRFETALLTGTGVKVVERYDTEEQAVEGHQRWAQKARHGLVIQPLGPERSEGPRISYEPETVTRVS